MCPKSVSPTGIGQRCPIPRRSRPPYTTLFRALLRLTPKLSGRQERHTQNQPEGPPVRCYLSFFSRFPLISNSCFWPPKSDAPLPLSLSRQSSAIPAFGLFPARLPLGRPRNESL